MNAAPFPALHPINNQVGAKLVVAAGGGGALHRKHGTLEGAEASDGAGGKDGRGA